MTNPTEGTKLIQQGLKAEGFDPGPIDGIRGPKTIQAVRDWITPTAQPTGRVPPWISEVLSVFGLHETRDKEALSKWLRSDGKFLGDPSALPWCGDLVETAIKRAIPGEPFLGALGENPYWALNWKTFGVPVRPTQYCVGVWDRPGAGAHVGFLLGEDKTHHHVLGGNQDNKVGVVRIEKSRLFIDGTRWPKTYKLPSIYLPQLSAENVATSANEV